MIKNNRVVWYEGMFLKPEHFEQDFRYVENAIQNVVTYFNKYCYGLKTLSIDHSLLEQGKCAVTQVSGVFRDGTVFQAPERDLLPQAISVTAENAGKNLYLILPFVSASCGLVTREHCTSETYRYVQLEDNETSFGLPKETCVASLNMSLVTEDDLPADCLSLPVLRVQSVDELGSVTLDGDFIPNLINIKQSTPIVEKLNHIYALMQQRGRLLGDQIGVVKRGLGSNTFEFLYLQTINRYMLRWKQILSEKVIHPYNLFEFCLNMTGDLSVFSQEGSQIKLPEFPVYDHQDLNKTLFGIFSVIESQLGGVITMRAIHLELEDKKYGIRLAKVTDHSLLNNCRVILAVSSQVPAEQLRLRFPQQAKIAPAEKLTELIQLQLPGLKLEPIQVVPEEMPYYQDYVYFEVEQQNELWGHLSHSIGFAIHPGADYPSLELELWVIKQE